MKDLGLKAFTTYLGLNALLFIGMLHDGLTDSETIFGKSYDWNGTQIFFLCFMVAVCIFAAGICVYVIIDNKKYDNE